MCMFLPKHEGTYSMKVDVREAGDAVENVLPPVAPPSTPCLGVWLSSDLVEVYPPHRATQTSTCTRHYELS